MNRSQSTYSQLRVAGSAALLGLLLLAGCDHPTSPVDAVPDAPGEPAGTVAHLILMVDEASALVDLNDAMAAGGEAGPALSLVPGGPEIFGPTSVTCDGCGDGILDNQMITIDLTVKRRVDWVDGVYWDELACRNCVVRSVRFRGKTAGLVPGDTFQIMMQVDALRREQFAVEFRLLCAC